MRRKQHVFHFHGFDDGHAFTGLHFLTDGDGHIDQQTGHGRQHETAEVRRRFERHLTVQLGHAWRHHQGIDAPSVVLYLQDQRVFGRTAFHLSGEGLAVHRAFDGNIVQARRAVYSVVFAIDFDDGGTAPTCIVDFYIAVLMLAFGVECDHRVFLTHFDVIAG